MEERLPQASIDLTDPGLHAEGPPHDLFARMREEPVSWCPHEGAEGGGFWTLTRHADIAAVSRDTKTFSSSEGGIFIDRDRVSPLELARNLLLYKDPPDHTKYRKILQSAFVPRAVEKMEPQIRGFATDAIDAVIADGRCDAVADIAVPIPLHVLAMLIGVPATDVPKLKYFTDEIEAAQLSPEAGAGLPVFAEIAVYLNEQLEAQKDSDEDTVVNRLRAAEVDGQHLTDDEIVLFFALLIFAGNDTTRNTTSSAILALLGNREQWERLCADPSLMPGAVEELLRHTSVVNYFCRTATEDTEVAGQPIPAGDKVMMWYSSGSRDEAVCPHAQDLDVSRTEHSHMAFGGGGRHFCLGAGLARLQLRIIFEELTARVPDARLAGEPERLRSSWANSLTSLPIEFTPGERSCPR